MGQSLCRPRFPVHRDTRRVAGCQGAEVAPVSRNEGHACLLSGHSKMHGAQPASLECCMLQDRGTKSRVLWVLVPAHESFTTVVRGRGLRGGLCGACPALHGPGLSSSQGHSFLSAANNSAPEGAHGPCPLPVLSQCLLPVFLHRHHFPILWRPTAPRRRLLGRPGLWKGRSEQRRQPPPRSAPTARSHRCGAALCLFPITDLGFCSQAGKRLMTLAGRKEHIRSAALFFPK